jgi:TatD DNase family protein
MSGMHLVDSHCHLNLPELGSDLPGLLARAAEAGIQAMVVPGIDLASSRKAVELAERWPLVYAAVGVHPHHASSWTPAARTEMRALARSPRVVAIGETGLDFHRNLSARAAQVQSFREHLELAAECALPVIVHTRSASDDVLAELEAWAARHGRRNGRPTGVLHAFSGDHDGAQRATALGFLLGVAGPVTYPRGDELRAVLRRISGEHLIVETDAPYLTPVPHRGRRNEPAYVELVARGLAAALDLDPMQLASRTTGNAAHLFGWDHDDTNRNLL